MIKSKPAALPLYYVSTHILLRPFVVDSLDKHMQNEKELIRPRRILPAARATRARSAQFYVVLICHDSTGVGGLFCICVESINLT